MTLQDRVRLEHLRSLLHGQAVSVRLPAVLMRDDMPPDISLTLPLPLSANRMWTHARGTTFKSREYKAWAVDVYWLCSMQRTADNVSGLYELRLVAPRSRLDLDNVIKPTCDALQQADVITNDKYARRIVLEVDEAREAGSMLVELWALGAVPKPTRKRVLKLTGS